MDRACSARISAGVTACDGSEMSLQSGEIRPQPRRPRQWAMDSRASHDTHRAARFTSLPAPPAPILVMPGPVVSPAAVEDAAAMVSENGAGAVVRAGFVVAPVLLGDGPGTVRRPDDYGIGSPQTDTAVRYLPRCRAIAERVSIRTRAPRGSASGPVRCDRSFHRPSRPAEGTRSGDRRDVSLSPVPASHNPRPKRDACDNPPSRICRLCVAMPRS